MPLPFLIGTALVGMKADMEEQRQVGREEGIELAQRWRILFYELSASEF